MLSKDHNQMIDEILKNYANIYLFKDKITDTDLSLLFSRVDDARDLCTMFKTFMSAGVSPDLINAKVQYALFQSKPFVRRTLHVDDIHDLLHDFNIAHSEDTLQRCIMSGESGCYTNIKYPRHIINYSIMNISKDAFGGSAHILHYILQYTITNNVKLSDDEIIQVFNNYFSDSTILNILAKERPAIAKTIITRHKPFSNKVMEAGIVNTGPVLRFLTKHKCNDVIKAIPQHKQKDALKAYPHTDLLMLFPRSTDNDLAYLTANKPCGYEYRNFAKGFIKPASDISKAYIDIIGKICLDNTIKPEMFVVVTNATVISALIHTQFDRLTWLKVMENILQKNPGLSHDILNDLIKTVPESDVLVYKYFPNFFGTHNKTATKTPQKKVGIFENLFTNLFDSKGSR